MKLAFAALLLSAIATTPAHAGWHEGWGGGGFIPGVIGGIVGGIIGGAVRPPPPPYYPYPPPAYYPPPVYAPTPDQIAYCAQRFRSYNPNTGFYFGWDGAYHRCP